MDENGRKPKPKYNPVREWISDNLRYMMLIGGIIIVVLVIFLVLRAVMGGGEETTKNTSVVSAQESSLDSSESEVTPTPTATPEATPTPEETVQSSQDASAENADAAQAEADAQAAAEAQAAADAQAAQETAQQNVTAAVTAYFNALSAGDANAAAAVADGLTAEDLEAISTHAYGETYTNVNVYIYPGDADGTYVAIAAYEYKYPDYATMLPALTQFYVATGANGSMYIPSQSVQEEKAAYMDTILAQADVQALIQDVQARYDAALAADPALAAYVNQ